MSSRAGAAQVVFALLALSGAAAFAGDAVSNDQPLFGHALTAERGERLRLAAKLDPEGWPALRDVARRATSVRDESAAADTPPVRRSDPAVVIAISRIDATISALAERLKAELRRAPLDALDAVTRADLDMLRAAEPHAAGYCADYLWRTPETVVGLNRVARQAARKAELARLRAIAAARSHDAVSPAYYAERIPEEQAQLRGAGLAQADIATVFSETRPLELKSKSICRAAIRYLEAVLAYPAELKTTVLAYRMSGDYGYGSVSDE